MARLMCDRCSGYDSEHDATCPNLIGMEWTTEVTNDGGTVFITQRWPREADPKVFDARETAIMENLGGQYAIVARQRTDDPVAKTVRQQTQFVRYAALPHKTFVSPESAADATVETEMTSRAMPSCHKCGMYGQKVRILNGIYTCDTCYDAGHGHAVPCIKSGCACSGKSPEHDLSAMQPNPPAAMNALPVVPPTVTVPANTLEKGGRYRWHSELFLYVADPDRETHADGMRVASEEISVKWQKRDDLNAAMLRECRAALAKLREWPRCKEHDAPMAVKCCLPFSGNGKRYVFAGCQHEGCHATSSAVEVELSGPTARAIGDEAWTVEGFNG